MPSTSDGKKTASASERANFSKDSSDYESGRSAIMCGKSAAMRSTCTTGGRVVCRISSSARVVGSVSPWRSCKPPPTHAYLVSPTAVFSIHTIRGSGSDGARRRHARDAESHVALA